MSRLAGATGTVLLLLVWSVRETCADLSRAEAARLRSRAEELLDKGDERGALALARDAVRDEPEGASAWLLMGYVRTRRDEPEQAEEALRKACELAPRHPEAHMGLGVALMGQGRNEEALPELQAAVRLSNGFAGCRVILSSLHLRLGQFAQARSEAAAAVQTEPGNVEARLLLGMALLFEGDLQEAIGELTRTADAGSPARVRGAARYGLTLAFMIDADAEKAAATARGLRNADPDSAPVRSILATILVRLGQVDQAVAEMREAARLEPEDPYFRAGLAAVLMHAGELAEAHDCALAAAREDLDEPEYGCLGDVLLAMGELGDAEVALRSDLAEPDDDTPPQMPSFDWDAWLAKLGVPAPHVRRKARLACCLALQHQREEAVELLREIDDELARERADVDTAALYYAARAYRELDEGAMSRHLAARATKAFPDHPWCREMSEWADE